MDKDPAVAERAKGCLLTLSLDSLEVSSSESSAILLELNGQAIAAGGQPGQPSVVTLTQKDLKTAGGDSH